MIREGYPSQQIVIVSLSQGEPAHEAGTLESSQLVAVGEEETVQRRTHQTHTLLQADTQTSTQYTHYFSKYYCLHYCMYLKF